MIITLFEFQSSDNFAHENEAISLTVCWFFVVFACYLHCVKLIISFFKKTVDLKSKIPKMRIHFNGTANKASQQLKC